MVNSVMLSNGRQDLPKSLLSFLFSCGRELNRISLGGLTDGIYFRQSELQIADTTSAPLKIPTVRGI